MTLELYDPARAATQLRDGLPQQSSLRAEAMEYFTFRVGGPPTSCSAPLSGGAQCTDDDAQVARLCALDLNRVACGGEPHTCAAALAHFRGIGSGGLRAACATALPAPSPTSAARAARRDATARRSAWP